MSYKKPKYTKALTGLLTLCCYLVCGVLSAQLTQTLKGGATTNTNDIDTGKVATTPLDTGIVKLSKNAIKSKLEYNAEDSIRFEVKKQKVYLWGDAFVSYQGTELTADYIEIDWSTNTITAFGLPDSTGKTTNRPNFSQGGTSFDADTVRYNTKSKKGKISNVVTQEGQGYIHGEQVKKDADDNVCIRNGEYTTCNRPDHPHFSIRATKIKIVNTKPDSAGNGGSKKIITGPAYLQIEDVPTPLALPFGFFPGKSERSSGIVVPTYGESPAFGFFLRDGGYYFGKNDKVDLALLGDIYSRGSWGLKAISNYNQRYKFNGTVDIRYSRFANGSRFLKEVAPELFSTNADFFIRWQHTVSSKARPGTTFSANVNAGTSNYQSLNALNTQAILTNTFVSSVAYSLTRSWYNLALNANHSQNTISRDVSITLPEGQFNVMRFFPLKRKKQVGPERWYEKIGVNGNVNFTNRINTKDSLLFTEPTLRRMQNGAQGQVSASTQFKVLKYFTLSPSVNLITRLYTARVRKEFDNTANALITDTLFFWQSLRNMGVTTEYNAALNLSTRLYAMGEFKRGAINALRLVVTPQLSFNYRPNFDTRIQGFYGPNGTFGAYSPYEIGVFGQPSVGRQGAIGLNINNNLEMKVRDRRDTTGTGLRKVMLLDQFNIGTSYNLAADSLQLAPIAINGRTTLFKNVNLNFNSTFNPYATDSLNRPINTYYFAQTGRLARLTNANLAINFALRPKEKPKKNLTDAQKDALKNVAANPDMFIDFNLPYTLNVSYSLNYNAFAAGTPQQPRVTQTLNFTGDVSLSPKTKIAFNTGYDFINKEAAFTSLDIFRDLHCWELSANWIPFGFRRSYNLSIRVKASVLQDLKVQRRRAWQDLAQ